MGAQVKSTVEECAKGTEQRSNNATVKDARTTELEEECA